MTEKGSTDSMSRNQRRKLTVVGNDIDDIKQASKRHYSPHDLNTLTPKTDTQRAFLEAFYQDIPVIMQVGSAGTGKTFLALYAALSDVLDRSTVFEKVILIRSSVQARQIGHLKGTEDEKNEVYESAYEALCDQLLVFKQKNYHNLKAKGLIEFHNTSFLRGKTFDNAIIIVDECENCTYHELCTAFTRLGINSRIVFAGDFKQCDLKGTKHDQSGLGEFLKVLNAMPKGSYEQITYRPEDVVRSGIVKEFLLAEERVNS